MKSAQETSTPQSPPITTLSDIMSVIIIIKLWWSECELECKWLIIGRTLLWGWKKKDACHAQSGQSELDEGARSTGVSLARSHPAQIEMVQCLPVWTCCSDPKLPSGHFKGSAQLYHKKKKKQHKKPTWLQWSLAALPLVSNHHSPAPLITLPVLCMIWPNFIKHNMAHCKKSCHLLSALKYMQRFWVSVHFTWPTSMMHCVRIHVRKKIKN